MAKELEVVFQVTVRTPLDDDEVDAEAVKHCLEQDLQNAKWDCDLEVLESKIKSSVIGAKEFKQRVSKKLKTLYPDLNPEDLHFMQFRDVYTMSYRPDYPLNHPLEKMNIQQNLDGSITVCEDLKIFVAKDIKRYANLNAFEQDKAQKKMDFDEFLQKYYELTEEEFEAVSESTKSYIEDDWSDYIYRYLNEPIPRRVIKVDERNF